MRNQLSTITLLLLAGCAITGCSKSDSGAPPSASTVAPQATAPAPKKLDNLALFNGKAPDGLVADATIGQSIRSVVPQAQFKCMSETFNYMPDLALESDGSLQATLSGSRAENWLMAYLSVNPSGLAKSSVEIEACERGKERCYEKSGAMVGICLNALRSARGC